MKVEAFTADLAEGVAYAKNPPSDQPLSGAIYGGVPGGATPEVVQFLEEVMGDLLDGMQDVPAPA